MFQKKDKVIIGQRYGDWVAREKIGKVLDTRYDRWICVCSKCGEERNLTAMNLRNEKCRPKCKLDNKEFQGKPLSSYDKFGSERAVRYVNEHRD